MTYINHGLPGRASWHQSDYAPYEARHGLASPQIVPVPQTNADGHHVADQGWAPCGIAGLAALSEPPESGACVESERHHVSTLQRTELSFMPDRAVSEFKKLAETYLGNRSSESHERLSASLLATIAWTDRKIDKVKATDTPSISGALGQYLGRTCGLEGHAMDVAGLAAEIVQVCRHGQEGGAAALARAVLKARGMTGDADAFLRRMTDAALKASKGNATSFDELYLYSVSAWARLGPANEGPARARLADQIGDLKEQAGRLDARGYNLTSLPALPATLRQLEASKNALSSLPPLPATLVDLRVNNNDLRSLPALPPSLMSLHVSENGLTRVPDDLPATLRRLDLRKNRLTSVPDGLLSLREYARVYLEGNAIPETIMQCVWENTNAPQYMGPIILFGTDLDHWLVPVAQR